MRGISLSSHFHVLSFFILSLLFIWSPKVRAANTTTVDVGVILDTGSWIGNISWSCMTMALEEFYAENRNYTTRINLHLRDSGEKAFGAADAALDLLKNVKVQAIIGPQTSSEAKFVVELADRTHVPVISFSAKSPSLSPQRSPYFIRTGLNDSVQAKVIASIIEVYKWKEVVLIFEDTDYGNGIVPYLIDALQEVEADVRYRCSLALLSTRDQIMEELVKLRKKQTRVFVVHMSYSLGFQLFKIAEEAGMMGQGYVWITTYGLTDLADLMGSSAAKVMRGFLGVKPYVGKSNKLQEFKLRWRNKYHQISPGAKISEPTVFGLWAYDTVCLLARSVESAGLTNSTFQNLNATDTNSTDFERLGLSMSGPVLLNQTLGTKFDGISGKFDLTDGQLQSKAFEIVNIAEHGKKTIGFWTPANGTSGNVNSKEALQGVIWPGGQKSIPKGWKWPTMGRKLQIGIPVKPGFDGFVKRLENGSTIGYCIEVFDAVMAQMPYHVPYEYVPYADAHGNMKGTYDDLVYEVYLQNFDAVVGDVTIISNRSLYVDFTLPYTESGVSMVVPVKDKRNKGAWTFLEPLTTDLWLASGAFFIFTGFVVWFLEHRINDDFRGTASNQLGTIFYFAFSTLVFAHREKVVSNLTRVVVIIWLFAVLVLQSSYTASLSSKLTVEQLQPTVTDINELLKNGASVGYLDESFMPALLKRLNFNESKLIAYQSPEDYNDAMSNGTVAAVFDEIPYLKVFISRYCNKYTMTGPTYKADGFGFVFPKGSPLVPDISRAVLRVMEGENMTRFEKELFGDGQCPYQDVGAETSSSLRVSSFWGLFLITGVASFSALTIYLALFLYGHRDLLTNNDSNNASPLVRRVASLIQVYDQRDNSHARALERPETPEGPAISPRAAASGSQSPSSMFSVGEESFEMEGIAEVASDEEGTPGREISGQYRDPPSFADMLSIERASSRSV